MSRLINLLPLVALSCALMSPGVMLADDIQPDDIQPDDIQPDDIQPCGKNSVVTGKTYAVRGSEIYIRTGPGTEFEKLRNPNAMETTGAASYYTVDNSMTVFEGCREYVWSKIYVSDPAGYSETHQGWMASKFLVEPGDVDMTLQAQAADPASFEAQLEREAEMAMQARMAGQHSEAQADTMAAEEMAAEPPPAEKTDDTRAAGMEDKETIEARLEREAELAMQARMAQRQPEIEGGALTPEEMAAEPPSGPELAEEMPAEAIEMEAEVDVFTESSFRWDAVTTPYKEIIITGVNRIHRQNPHCENIDPSTTYVSSTEGSEEDPVFFVTCGQGYSVFNFYFSKSDVENNKDFSTVEPSQ